MTKGSESEVGEGEIGGIRECPGNNVSCQRTNRMGWTKNRELLDIGKTIILQSIYNLLCPTHRANSDHPSYVPSLWDNLVEHN